MTRFRYPDPDQPQPLFTLPPTAPVRRGQRTLRLVGIVLPVAVGLGAIYLCLQIFGSPPQWLKWALLAPALLYLGFKRHRDDAQRSGRAAVPVGHVAAHMRDVDVPAGVLRMRRGLADEHSSLETARILVPRSPYHHLRAPNPERVAPHDR